VLGHEIGARLVDIGELDRLAHLQLARVRLLAGDLHE